MLHFLYIAVSQPGATEKEADRPETCKTDNGVDDAAEDRCGTEQPSHQVKLENAYQPPVDAADDGKDQCQNIHMINLLV